MRIQQGDRPALVGPKCRGWCTRIWESVLKGLVELTDAEIGAGPLDPIVIC